MLNILHPKLGKIDEYAVLSVASYHDNFKTSPFFRFLDIGGVSKFPQEITNCNGFTSSDIQRSLAIENSFEVPRFVLASKGGYGCIRSIENVEVDKNWQGVLCGFSDLTVLINYLAEYTKVACFHGPMFNYPKTWDHSTFLKNSFEWLLCSEASSYTTSFDGEFLHGSKIMGKMFGGNLSVLCSLIGTPFEIQLKDRVLFLEEINEPSYKIDRMLMQLSLLPGFKRLKGIVFGQFTNCGARPVGCGDLEVYPMIKSFVQKWEISALWNAPIGHIEDFMVVPINGESCWSLGNENQIDVTLSYPTNI